MITNILFFVFGLVFVWKSADFLVESSAQIAKKFQIPELIVGLTLLAFGTSAPELAVNLFAIINNKPDIVFGNILGSNISNVLLILGVGAIISPIGVSKIAKKVNLPFNVLITILLCLLIYIPSYKNPEISLLQAMILLVLFVIFLCQTYFLNKTQERKEKDEIEDERMLKPGILFVIGLIGLPLGGNLVINSAIKIAVNFGISEALIAVFAIAMGTSLPELVTVVIASLKNKTEIVIGNILGSNIFNILFIFGICGLIKPLSYNTVFNIELGINIVILLLLIIFIYIGKKGVLTKIKGSILFGFYICYLIFVITRG